MGIGHLVLAAFITGIAAAPALAGTTPSPDGARVYFVNIEDGDNLTNPVLIQFGLEGMGVAPAGAEGFEHTGHHHLLINEQLEGEELNEPVPADDQHVHFGGGQTQVEIELPPGEHVLQLVLADANHIPHDPPVMSERITVTVK
ncbi:MAG: DUF4399 domain-containing protein [Geminicoccaceae bacterium]